MNEQGNDKTRNGKADMLNPLQPGVDGVIPQFAYSLMRGQANVEFVDGSHHSSLTTGLVSSSILRPAAASSARRWTTSFNAVSRCICTACTMSCGSVFSSSLTVCPYGWELIGAALGRCRAREGGRSCYVTLCAFMDEPRKTVREVPVDISCANCINTFPAPEAVTLALTLTMALPPYTIAAAV